MESDFSVKMADLSERARRSRDSLQSEHSTKSALVMPFIAALGYDVFNPLEVVPEYTADVGIKKGEKVDFAILRDGGPIMLIECKPYGAPLNSGKCSQLFRYFTAKPTARIGILTNGTKYMFFTDLEKPNIMDQTPYMEFDLENMDQSLIPEIAKLAKQNWNIDLTLSGANDLKYSRAIRKILAEEFQCPSDEMVRYLAGKTYSGRLTQAVKEQFTGLIKRAFRDFLHEQMKERFDAAVATDTMETQTHEGGEQDSAVEQPRVQTTEEEWQAFYLIKSLVRDIVDLKRVVMRDAQSYCAILLDDNNRKPICRLHFNGKQKYIGLFDVNKTEERIALVDIDGIFGLAERLKAAIINYG